MERLLPDKAFLTVVEIARHLEVSPACVRRWVTRGRLRALTPRMLVPRDELVGFLASTEKEASR